MDRHEFKLLRPLDELRRDRGIWLQAVASIPATQVAGLDVPADTKKTGGKS